MIDFSALDPADSASPARPKPGAEKVPFRGVLVVPECAEADALVAESQLFLEECKNGIQPGVTFDEGDELEPEWKRLAFEGQKPRAAP